MQSLSCRFIIKGGIKSVQIQIMNMLTSKASHTGSAGRQYHSVRPSNIKVRPVNLPIPIYQLCDHGIEQTLKNTLQKTWTDRLTKSWGHLILPIADDVRLPQGTCCQWQAQWMLRKVGMRLSTQLHWCDRGREETKMGNCDVNLCMIGVCKGVHMCVIPGCNHDKHVKCYSPTA